jgi:hypothetical protein
MQSASPTPQDLKIQPRNVMFARDEGTDRWWNRCNPIATAFYNGLSLTFPKGEAFFIDSVRHYRDAVPAELQSQIDADAAGVTYPNLSHHFGWMSKSQLGAGSRTLCRMRVAPSSCSSGM